MPIKRVVLINPERLKLSIAKSYFLPLRKRLTIVSKWGFGFNLLVLDQLRGVKLGSHFFLSFEELLPVIHRDC